jgi:hypothetical protein
MINEVEAKRVVKQAERTIQIVKAVRKGLTANEIVHEVGCNQSVAAYYIRLLTNKN